MQIEDDPRTLDDLIVDFCDEDITTWTAAARVIGQRAVADAAALEFIRRRLAEGSDAAGRSGEVEGYRTTGLSAAYGGPPHVNVHRYRHAWCAMASYLSAGGVAEALADILDERVRRPVLAICLNALRADGGTIAQLKQIPDLADQFDGWLEQQTAARRRNVAKFRNGGNPRALEANRKALEALERLDDASPIPEAFRPPALARAEVSEWLLACYFAGVQTDGGLLGLPLLLLVRSLLAEAVRRGAAGFPLVLSLPQMLARLDGHAPADEWAAAVSLLCEHVSPDWVAAREQYNEYVVHLAQLPGAPPFRTLWAGAIGLPDRLAEDLAALEALSADEADADQAQRLACHVMRTIACDYFGDDWRWRERLTGEQFSLNVYTLLMIQGPAALLLGRDGFDPGSLGRCRPKLQHRIHLLLEAIEISARGRSTILPALVRCLKFLLRYEIAMVWAGTASGGGSVAFEEFMALCHRQLLIVKRLMSDWLLPTTLRKDLAVIVCRILHRAYRLQKTHRSAPARNGSPTREYAVELVYIMLFAFPDNLLLREMVEYSTDEDLCRLFDCIRHLIEDFEGHDAASIGMIPRAERVARFASAVDNWKRRYRDFSQLLRAISLHDDRPGDQRWIDGLCDLVGHLSREDPALDATLAHPERPLQPIVLYGQKSRQDWRTLQDAAKGLREDRTGAMDERSERESREHLAARAVAGRFEDMVDEIRTLESDCLPEVGQPHMEADLVHRWRRLINQLHELSRLCAEELPGLERKLCACLLDHRIHHDLEPRLQQIAEIVDQEKEADATEILKRQVQIVRSQDASTPESRSATRDMGLIQDWMLGRYMIRELAESYGLGVLKRLTNLRFVAAWIMLPFVLCALLHVLKFQAWRGVPFAVVCLVNFAVIGAFALEAKRRLPRLGRARISPWRFLLPQTTAAIFVAILSTIPSDERWSLTIKANLPVQILTWVLFLVVGFVFTREIILGRQFRGQKQRKQKNRRAMQLMALSLWQSFALVMFFAMTVGRIMAADDRGHIVPEEFTGLGKLIGNLLPIEVYLGEGFVDPASSRAAAAFWIYPRALVSWTIQMFFFGAIFERIMGRSDR